VLCVFHVHSRDVLIFYISLAYAYARTKMTGIFFFFRGIGIHQRPHTLAFRRIETLRKSGDAPRKSVHLGSISPKSVM